jgi:hypothetical protein
MFKGLSPEERALVCRRYAKKYRCFFETKCNQKERKRRNEKEKFPPAPPIKEKEKKEKDEKTPTPYRGRVRKNLILLKIVKKHSDKNV